MDQEVLDEAVRIATRNAMNGTPVDRVVWIPPQTAASDRRGIFVVQYGKPQSASETPPWQR